MSHHATTVPCSPGWALNLSIRRNDNGVSPFPSSHGGFGSPNAANTPRSVPGTTPGTGSRRSQPSGTPRSAFRTTCGPRYKSVSVSSSMRIRTDHAAYCFERLS